MHDSLLLIQWFADNHTKANPEKFQAVAVGECTYKESISFNLDNNVINCEESVKLLGVTVDFRIYILTSIFQMSVKKLLDN